MTRLQITLLVLLAAVVSIARGEELSFTFSADHVNQTPPGYASVVFGEGEPGRWQIIEAEVPPVLPPVTAKATIPREPVLAQLARDITDEHYPILVYTNEIFRDFRFTTRVKCVGGVVEQMAGVVFRYQDPQNFYYLRASAKGNTFRFAKVVGGQRANPIGPEIEVPGDAWHEIAVECEGNRIRCFLNGEQVIPDLTDNSLTEGFVGFWTKSDAVSYFTDARITYTPRETFAAVLLQQMEEKFPRVLGMRLYAVPPGKEAVEVIASLKEEEVGGPGSNVEADVLNRDSTYFGRLSSGVVVTLPLHDRNGETVAALRVEMKSFPGQTENNAFARALPIVREIENRLQGRDLF